MPTITVNGCAIEYEIVGSGEPVVFTPGGRAGRDQAQPLAEIIASEYRVLTYDRRNCGASEVAIGGDGSESELWADDLAELLKALDMAPAFVGGWSAGCVTSLHLVNRHPEVVRGLILGLVAGGLPQAERIARDSYGQYAGAAEKGGMQAVADIPYYAARIEANPANRDRILGMDPAEFIQVMRKWEQAFVENSGLAVAGATEEQLKAIRVPTMIVAGDDELHLRAAGEALHRMVPHSEFHEPVVPRDEWARLWTGPPREMARVLGERHAPIFLEFVRRVGAGQPVPGN